MDISEQCGGGTSALERLINAFKKNTTWKCNEEGQPVCPVIQQGLFKKGAFRLKSLRRTSPYYGSDGREGADH